MPACPPGHHQRIRPRLRDAAAAAHTRPRRRSQASTIERYILILCFYLRLILNFILYPYLCLILSLIRLQISSIAWIRLHSLANFKRRLDSLAFACKFQASLGFACIRLHSLAMFKRRLNSLGFACKFQASLAFACIRLQISSVAWMRLRSLASFKRRLDALAFACKFQASLGFAWVRLQISSVAWIRLRSLASFKRRLDSLGFACKFQASLFRHDCCCIENSHGASLTNKKTPCTPLNDVQGEWLQVPTARKPAGVCQSVAKLRDRSACVLSVSERTRYDCVRYRSSTAATCALVERPCGCKVSMVMPESNPCPTAHSTDSFAQSLTLAASL